MSTQAIQWTASRTQTWVTVSRTNGTLAAGASTNITVSLNSGANALPEGMFADTVTFSNVTTTIAQRRPVRLTVYTSPRITLSPRSMTVTNILGGRTERTLMVSNAANADANLWFTLSTRETGHGLLAQAAAGVGLPPVGRDFTKVQSGVPYRAGYLLVRFAPGVAGTSRASLLAQLGGAAVAREYELVPGLCLVKLPVGQSVEQALTPYNKAAGVLYAEPDYEVKASVIPNDARFGELWGMHNTGQSGGLADADIDAPEAWDVQTGSGESVVAVIDTGVDYNHEDLSANMWRNGGEIAGNGVDDDGDGYVDDVYGINAITLTGDPMDDHDHGTHCAGTIGGVGNNGVGVAGVCWNVRIMALKFLDAGGSGYDSDAITCIQYAILKGAKVLSNSWGGGGYEQALKDAIDAAGAVGIVFCAAAGNSGMDTDSWSNYPSCYTSSNIIAVMATDNSDLAAYFSNYGRTTVDLGAPGVDILSCRRGGGYQLMSGTSMATPHVAGACGLLLSRNPSLTVEQMESALLRTVDVPAIPLTCVSSGRMNIARALLQVGASWVTVSPSAGTNIPPGSAVNVTVGFDADAMAAGTYSGQVVVASNDRNTPMTNVPVTMVILRDNLRIAPTNEFVSSGEEGGPFTPATRVYTLTNAGASILNWTAASTTAWLRVAPTSGALAAGASVSATATITSVANGLSVGSYGGIITFSNRSSGAAQWRRVSLRVVPQVIYTFALDTNPGWTTEGQWAFGQPLGLGGDPTAGYTGLNVYGYNLAGTYSNLMPVYRLTTTALDCSGYTNINLSFRRWLGVEGYFCDQADIEVSTNGVTWTTVWAHTSGGFQDTDWMLVSYPLPGFVSDSPTVYIRWGMGPTDGSVVYSGWNIDDVVITGNRIAVPPLSVTPSGLNFGTVAVGMTSNLAFLVRNTSTGVLAGTASSTPGTPFTVVAGSPYSLAVGQSTSVVVRYSAMVAGTDTGTVTFTYTGGGIVLRPVIGRALGPPPVPFGPIPTNRAVGVPTNTWLSWNNSSMAGVPEKVHSALRAIVERSGVLDRPIAPAGGMTAASGNTSGVSVIYTRPDEIASVRSAAELGIAPAGLLDVAICGAPSDDSWNQDVQTNLLRTGFFNSVSIINVSVATPTLVELRAFDAVLVFSDMGYLNPVAMGDVMADYVDAGGGVVCMMFEACYVGMQGRWDADAYYAIPRSGQYQEYIRAYLGTVHDPSHPIMQGVTTFDGGSSSYRTETYSVAPGAIRIADWSDGRPLVAVKDINGIHRADLAFYPPSSAVRSDFWTSTTDGARLMANALVYVGGDDQTFNVYFGTALQPTNVIYRGGVPRCDPGMLRMGVTYYWKVVASNAVGSSTGPVWRFTTESLAITPTNGLDSSGHRGGPFSPSNIVYQLANMSTQAIQWTASRTQTWVTVSRTNGTLAAGATTNIKVSLNSGANALPEGMFADTVTFSNVTTTIAQRRPVRLTVYTSPRLTLTPRSMVVTNRLGGRTERTLMVSNAANADANLWFTLSTRETGHGLLAQAAAGVGLPPVGRDFTKVQSGVPYRAGYLLMRFAPGVAGTSRASLLAQLGGATVAREYEVVPGLCLVKLPAGQSVEQALTPYNKAAGVLYAEPDYEVKASVIPNDTRFGELWGMHNTGQSGGLVDADIDAPEAWDVQTGSGESVVAVIDTGVDYNHEDLSANMWRNGGEIAGNGVDDDGDGYVDDVYGINAITLTGDPMDDHDHGTHCAGTIGGVGNNGVGVAGVCWNVRIMALKFLDAGGYGYDSDAITCIQYAILKGAKVLSNSWGGGGYEQALKDAIDAAGAVGIVFCAAAGNTAWTMTVMPIIRRVIPHRTSSR